MPEALGAALEEAKQTLADLQSAADRAKQLAEQRAAQEAAAAKRAAAERDLDAAAKGDSVDAIDAALERATVAGVPADGQAASDAATAREALVAKRVARDSLAKATEAADADSLTLTLAQCVEAGLDDSELVALRAALTAAVKRDDAARALEAARDSRNPMTLAFAVKTAKVAGVAASTIAEAETLLSALKRAHEAEEKKQERVQDVERKLQAAVASRDASDVDGPASE